MWRWFPSLRGGLCHGPGGQPAIHSSIPDMMGVRPRSDGLNQKRRPHQRWWATAYVERRVGPWPRLERAREYRDI